MSPVWIVGGFEGSCGAEPQTFTHQGFRLLWRTGFGDGNVTSAEAVRVELFQGDRRQFRAAHGYKSVAARLPSGRVEHQLHFGDGAHARKQALQFGFCYRRAQVSDI